MLFSQNGWSASQASLMATYTIPGTAVRVTLRKGDASVVLLYLAGQYDATVEKLAQADTGGYNPRSIIGARTLSNHASGTAMDLRWNRHVRGKKGTFTAAEKAAVRKILAFVNAEEKVVRWGEDYVSAPVDGMHFEVIGSPAAVSRTADRIRGVRAAKPSKPAGRPSDRPGVRTLRVGSKGGDVAFLQRWLGLADDGDFGQKTKAKVVAYQRMKGLTADGIVGPKTWRAMRVVR